MWNYNAKLFFFTCLLSESEQEIGLKSLNHAERAETVQGKLAQNIPADSLVLLHRLRACCPCPDTFAFEANQSFAATFLTHALVATQFLA